MEKTKTGNRKLNRQLARRLYLRSLQYPHDNYPRTLPVALQADRQRIAVLPAVRRRRNQHLRRLARTQLFAPSHRDHRLLEVDTVCLVGPSCQPALRMCHSMADTDLHQTRMNDVTRYLPEIRVKLQLAIHLAKRETTGSRTHETLANLVIAGIRATSDHLSRPAKRGRTKPTVQSERRGAIGYPSTRDHQTDGHRMLTRASLRLVLRSGISQLDRNRPRSGRSLDVVWNAETAAPRETHVQHPGCREAPTVECREIHRLQPPHQQLPPLHRLLADRLTTRISLGRHWP